MTRSTIDRRAADAGLTIIELMVAMLLGIMLSAGLYYMMAGQQKTYTGQFAAMTSQENLWGAMEYLQGQIRRAGYGFGGCPPDPASACFAPSLQQVDLAVTSRPKVKGYRCALTVQNNSNLFTGTSGGSDSLQLAYGIDPSASRNALTAARTTRVEPSPATPSTLVVNDGSLIKNNDLLVLWQHGSLKHCLVLQATGNATTAGAGWTVPCAGSTSHLFNPPLAQFNDVFPISGGYSALTLVMRVRPGDDPLVSNRDLMNSFAIDNSVSGRPPRLVTWNGTSSTQRQVVAEGIEDIQLAWACDVDQDGHLEEGTNLSARRTDEWAHNVLSDTPPICGNNSPIAAVRITLIARTTGPTSNRTGFRPAAEDRIAGTPAQDLIQTGNMGTFGRAVLTTVVKPRNIQRSVQ